jgi:hypothetical protein
MSAPPFAAPEIKIPDSRFKIDGLVKSPNFSFFVIPAPDRVRGKLQRESSDFDKFWIPPDRVRGRLIKPGMTFRALFTIPSGLVFGIWCLEFVW